MAGLDATVHDTAVRARGPRDDLNVNGLARLLRGPGQGAIFRRIDPEDLPGVVHSGALGRVAPCRALDEHGPIAHCDGVELVELRPCRYVAVRSKCACGRTAERARTGRVGQVGPRRCPYVAYDGGLCAEQPRTECRMA